MIVGIMGTGGVGQTLATGFSSKGYQVILGTRDPDATRQRTEPDAWGTPPVADLLANSPELDLQSFAAAAKQADVLVLAVKGVHAVDVIQAAGPDNLAGKLVLDTSNPLEPSESGIHKAAAVSDSVLQQVQRAAPDARFVKAWNCVPGIVMVDPAFPGGPGTQFICGDDAEAKEGAAKILAAFGWDAVDIGDSSMGPYVEGMAIAVINHGARSGEWDWGLKLITGGAKTGPSAAEEVATTH